MRSEDVLKAEAAGFWTWAVSPLLELRIHPTAIPSTCEMGRLRLDPGAWMRRSARVVRRAVGECTAAAAGAPYSETGVGGRTGERGRKTKAGCGGEYGLPSEQGAVYGQAGAEEEEDARGPGSARGVGRVEDEGAVAMLWMV